MFTLASCFVILYFVPANEFSFTRCALERNDGNPCEKSSPPSSLPVLVVACLPPMGLFWKGLPSIEQ